MSDNANDIAIVGAAMRVPGAKNVREYWKNLLGGIESIRTLTEEELIENGEDPENLRKPNFVPRAGMLDGMEMFDGEFFGFSPKESAILDPQHRHFTECVWEALEDAGHVPSSFEGRIGLFAGCGMGSYFYFNVCSHRELIDSVGLFLLRHTGNDKDFLATRVSYLLDLRGPSINVQTACSTSLVATHLACQSLLSGESDLALAGGVTIEIPHGHGYLFREGEVMSPDGHCHAFDHRAQGTVLASGTCVVALRRLSDALADGDHIYAVIKGSAVNNDGALKVGYLAPSVDGQTAAMVEAYGVGGIDPDTIGYVECHGTGTYMGDPIEISALTQAFRASTQRKGFCRIGSVKTSIGHLDTAAGTASLIKASLAVKHGQIPASLNFEKPNPTIDFENSPFVVNHSLHAWEKGANPRRAAINSLGVGGTNAHAVIEEPPAQPASSPSKRKYALLTLSARNQKALDGNSQRLAAHLRDNPDVPLADVAFTLHVGRKAFDRRRVVAASSHEEAARYLEQADTRRVFTHTPVDGKASVAFMFSGGGSQYPRMCIDLYESEPVFREHIDRGLNHVQKKHGIDLRPLMFPPKDQVAEAAKAFEATSRQLLGIAMVEYSLAKLWLSWGIEPTAVMGHSLGEKVAAAIAGVFQYEDLLDLVHLRGELAERTALGGMLSVPLPPDELLPLLGEHVDLGTVNTPKMCVASGAAAHVDALEKELTERGIEVRRLPIPRAGHSRMLDPILAEYGAFLRTLKLSAPTIPIVSNRTGAWLTPEMARDPEHWVRHLRETVRFADGVAVLLDDPKRVLLEVGPGQTLCSLARQHPKASQSTNIIASVRHRDDDVSDTQYFTTALGRLWASGMDAKLERLWQGETRRRVSLPTYAWVHQRYFIDAVAPQAAGEDLTRLKRLPTVDEYGFKPVWIERPAIAKASAGETWLFFMDDTGVGTRLVKRLRAKGHTVVCVFEGDAYHKRSDTEYTLSPERGRSGYDALVRDLMASGRAPSQIVHLWLNTTVERFRPGSSFFHRNLEHGFYSLFFLAQALGDENVPRPLHITVVSTGMQQMRDEALRYPEKATALGPIKVVPRELPGVTCSSIDLDLGNAGGTQLLQELLTTVRTGIERFAPSGSNGKNGRVSPLDATADLLERDLLGDSGNVVVAHRDGRRYVQEYQRHILQPTASELPTPLRPRGVYLITGGLGGIGLTIAQMLAKRAQARLVLLNRTELPERSEWDGWLARRGPTDRLSKMILRVRDLESLGAEVMVAGADVTNLEQMIGVVDAVKARFGGVNGVFHAAGVVRDNLIQLKTELDVQDVFAPKVHGTVVLDTLFSESMGLDFTVLFSSTSALAAPPGQVDYVAANAFLDAYARAPGRAARTIAINWGIWNGVGMAAEALSGGEEGASARMERLGRAAHPAFDERLRDARGRSIIEGAWKASEQWMLDEHRTGAGHALIPGTGYLELARAALESNAEAGTFELRDLFFIRPLQVPDEGAKDVRVRLQRSEEGYLFDVRSRTELDGRPGWELHAQARVLMHPMQPAARIDLAAIDARCTERRVPFTAAGFPSPQEAQIRFGPRWRVLRQVAYGDQEALATLELAPKYVADLEHYGLHPALVDIATGYAMYLIDGYKTEEVWVPVSYGSVRVHGKLPQSIRSWVRGRPTNKNNADFAVFDVTITDAQGTPLVEVKDFAIKRMGVQTDFAVASRPSRADVELEPGLGSDGDRELSPAELQLRRNYEQGIRAEEGSDALVRVLAGEALPQVAITSLDINQLIRQASHTADSSTGAAGTKFDRPELDSAYVAPRDEIERSLVGFWEELLGVDQVGVQDSFFDLGGHSLIAVRLFAMVKKAYQVEFPISVLFEAPTIERCAALIRETIGDRGGDDASAATDGAKTSLKEASPSRSRYRHLVAMHPGEGGSRTPMFLVAGMFGNVLNLRHLAHLIGTDRPFYGVQARGLYGDEAPHETFEEMAEAYIAEMRIVQPHGPYFIGGFSGGGITAFEIAHQLRTQGEEVALLAMLDSALPMEKPITAADRAKIQLQRFQRQGPAYVGTWARNRLKWEIEQLQKKLGDPEPLEHTPEQFQNDAIERAFRAALPRYRMRHLKGRIVLFRPKLEKTYVMGQGRFLTSEKRWVYEDNGWGPWCDEVEVHEVPGDHDAMVLEPNVRVLAGQLRQCIEDAERRRTIAPSEASVVAL
jgi:acyl transferase domain-containing protein/thioesterase domain-containing protein